MVGKSTHLKVVPQQSTQNAANLPLQTCEEYQGTFLLYDTSVDFSSCNNFVNLGFFAKVSVPVQSIIPCSNQGIIDTQKRKHNTFFSNV